MNIQIHIIDGPIPPHTPGLSYTPGMSGSSSESRGYESAAGAILTFDGIVRPTENGRPLAALSYEHYEPMSSQQLRTLAESILAKHNLLALHCHHSRGRVNAGECSMRVIIHSAHRKEALAAMAEFIDTLKRDVPIWKSVIWT